MYFVRHRQINVPVYFVRHRQINAPVYFVEHRQINAPVYFVRHRQINAPVYFVRHRQINAPVYFVKHGKLIVKRICFICLTQANYGLSVFVRPRQKRINSSLEISLNMPIDLMLKFTDISWRKIQIFCRPAYIYIYRVCITHKPPGNSSTSKMIVLIRVPRLY